MERGQADTSFSEQHPIGVAKRGESVSDHGGIGWVAEFAEKCRHDYRVASARRARSTPSLRCWDT